MSDARWDVCPNCGATRYRWTFPNCPVCQEPLGNKIASENPSESEGDGMS
jgi:hypothetical protein